MLHPDPLTNGPSDQRSVVLRRVRPFFSLPFSYIAEITESPNRFAPPGPGIARGSRRLLEIASRKYSGDSEWTERPWGGLDVENKVSTNSCDECQGKKEERSGHPGVLILGF